LKKSTETEKAALKNQLKQKKSVEKFSPHGKSGKKAGVRL